MMTLRALKGQRLTPFNDNYSFHKYMNSEYRIVFILPLFVSIFLENIRLIAPHVCAV